MSRLQISRAFALLPVAALLWCAGFSNGAQAQSLKALFDAAQSYDATYQAARQLAQATIAHGAQASAGVLPAVNLGAGASQTSQTSSVPAYDARNFASQTASITAIQPLYRPGNWAALKQGELQTALAQAQLESAEQDLIVRVSQAYFDVLAATDNLAFVRSQKVAVSEQMQSARRNFEVGTGTVVDTRDARARYDLVVAQELGADNDLRVKALALDQLVGMSATAPTPLRLPMLPGETLPATVDSWVEVSQRTNPQIRQMEIALAVAKLETRKAEAVNRPTLDLVGSYSATNNDGTSTGVTSSYSLNQTSIGIVFNLPLYAGNAIDNHVKEAVALQEKAQSDLDAVQRTVAQAARSAFFGLQTSRAQVAAYEAAQTSSQSALDANQLGYQVGVKINIDVLNAQSQLFDTMARLSRARYDVLLGDLKLRQASGTLQVGDLEAISAQLQ